MNEFTPKEPAAESNSPAKSTTPKVTAWYRRELFLGLNAPLLALGIVVIAAAGWYLFAPESKPDVNQLAFGDDSSFKPTAPRFNAPLHQVEHVPVAEEPAPEPASEQVMIQISKNLTAQVQGVQEHSDANRVAIERLSETIKSQMSAMEELQRQVKELDVKVMLASNRPAHAVESIGSMPAPKPPKRTQAQPQAPSSALDGMHLSAIQRGMAWILWQDQTWAVQTGERVGSVVVTAIDATNRKVYTSAGTLQ